MVLDIQQQSRPRAYSQMVEDIRRGVLSGELSHQKPILGELALAQKYAISRVSVRTGLKELVEEGLIQKRRGSGAYPVPPIDRQPISTAKNLRIGIIPPPSPRNLKDRDDYDAAPIEGVAGRCLMKSGKVTIYDSSISLDKLLEDFRCQTINGIIWTRCNIQQRHADIMKLDAEGVPQVFINRQLEGFSSVSLDHYLELAEPIKFLRMLGHEKIAFCNLPKTKATIFAERGKAFYKEMELNDSHSPDNKLLYKEEANSNYEDVFDTFIASGATAIILGGQGLAVHIAPWAQKRNLRVPEDISFVVLGDTELARASSPAITAYDEPRREAGKLAAELLEALIEGRARKGECIKYKGELIVRESCAPV